MTRAPSLVCLLMAAMYMGLADQIGYPNRNKQGKPKRPSARFGAAGRLRQGLRRPRRKQAPQTRDLMPAPKDFSCCKCVKNSFNFAAPTSDAQTCEEWKKAFIVKESQQVCDQAGCSENDYLPPTYTLVHPKYYAHSSTQDMIARGMGPSDAMAFNTPQAGPAWATPFYREYSESPYSAQGYNSGYYDQSGYGNRGYYRDDSGYGNNGYGNYGYPTRVTNGTSTNRGSATPRTESSTPRSEPSSSNTPSHPASSSTPSSTPPSTPASTPSHSNTPSSTPSHSSTPSSTDSHTASTQSSSSSSSSSSPVSSDRYSGSAPGGGHADAKWTDEHKAHEAVTIPNTVPGKGSHMPGFHRGTHARRKACNQRCNNFDAADVAQCVERCMKQTKKPSKSFK